MKHIRTGLEIVGVFLGMIPLLGGVFGGMWVASVIQCVIESAFLAIVSWILCFLAGLFIAVTYESWLLSKI